jgi:glycogen debranching enzyme
MRNLIGIRFFDRCLTVAGLLGLVLLASAVAADAPSRPLELSRTVRPWEFLPVVGERAGLFGNEGGRFEAWVYPIKILRDLRLTFHADGRALPAESLARTLTVHPESASILYASDTFSVRETLFVPVHEQGAVILIDVETEQPLEVEANFVADFQLEWPAALGGTYFSWDDASRAFVFGEEQRKFAALVGSPMAVGPQTAYQTNYSSSDENSIRLGVTQKGKDRKVIVLAASTEGLAPATATYQRLASSYSELLRSSAEYYQKYLDRTVRLELPDEQLQTAYDWSRISTLQGLVTNPFLGTGLVAGYRTSGTGQRPGFAWFFGRDSLWTSLALDSAGDFATTRSGLEFIGKFQREDGKIPHEISQGANFVPWFKDYPYGYASADATPLYIITMNDYVVQSGDVAFAQDKWDSLWRAYQFLKSTYDEQGLPKNFGVGHGWVEGGPLLPVKTEYYQSGLGVEALRALSNLAKLTGKPDVSLELSQAFDRQLPALNKAFWSSGKGFFAFALDNQNKQIEEPSVLVTVPMWFGLADEDKAQSMITQLADADHQTDWGMRIISSRSPHYGPGGYHFGSVWPLFTGWASVGEYRYHRSLPAYSNLRANASLASDGSLGHVTEVLSGDYYQGLSTSSPHQIWSAAMVISPILRGMLGLMTHAQECRVTFAPHVPADWTAFSVTNLHAGSASIDVQYQRSPDAITIESNRTGPNECSLDFSPALSPRAQVASVELNGRKLPFRIEHSAVDQHVSMRAPLASGTSTVRILLKNDFGLAIESKMPVLGSSSQGLRALSESWDTTATQMTAEFSGVPGRVYDIRVWNPRQLTSVEGGELSGKNQAIETLRIRIPNSTEPYAHHKVTFRFAGQRGRNRK